jgi:hypothetical protein
MNPSESAFTTAENKGRNKLKELLKAKGITKVQFPQDQFSNFDAVFSDPAGMYNYIAEVKDRDCSHTAFKDFILESKKYKSLMFVANQVSGMGYKNVRVLYINFFNDNYYSIWDITNLQDFDVTDLYCPKTTAEKQSSIAKETIMLKLDDAIDYGLLENKELTKSYFKKLSLKV